MQRPRGERIADRRHAQRAVAKRRRHGVSIEEEPVLKKVDKKQPRSKLDFGSTDVCASIVSTNDAQACTVVPVLEDSFEALRPLERVAMPSSSTTKNGRPTGIEKGREFVTSQLVAALRELPTFKGARVVLLDRDTLGLEFPAASGRSNQLLREMGLFGTPGLGPTHGFFVAFVAASPMQCQQEAGGAWEDVIDLEDVRLGATAKIVSSGATYEVLQRVSYTSGPDSVGIGTALLPGMSKPLQPNRGNDPQGLILGYMTEGQLIGGALASEGDAAQQDDMAITIPISLWFTTSYSDRYNGSFSVSKHRRAHMDRCAFGVFVRHDVLGANVTVWLALPWQIHYCDGAP